MRSLFSAKRFSSLVFSPLCRPTYLGFTKKQYNTFNFSNWRPTNDPSPLP